VPIVLIADDEPNIRRMVGALLTAEGYEVTETPSGVEAVARVREGEPDVALVDLMMPGELDGMATLAKLRDAAPDLPVIMMSGRAGLADAVKATKLGAFNFLEKPLTPEGVLLAVSSALELRQTRRVARALRAELGFAGQMVGKSEAMQGVRQLIARVAPTDARVLITAQNLHTFTNYKGFSPEAGSVANPIVYGADYGNVPVLKTFMAGIKLGL
jgi:two-component system nitrogen regulation response regulator NtrX